MLISAKDLLLQSIDLYKKHLGRYLTYSALLALPTILLSFAGVSIGVLMVMTGSFFTGMTIFVIVAIVLSVLTLAVSIALLRAVADDYSGKPMTSVMDTIKQALPLIIPAILISILTSLAVFGGMILLVIPGIIFAVWFTFAVHALVLDDRHSVDALKYSKSLVVGRWFGVLWRLFAPLLVISIVLAIVQWIFAMILGIETNSDFIFTLPQTIYLIISSLLSVLVTPLSVAIPTILYLELKKSGVMRRVEPDMPEKVEAAPAE